MVYKKLNNNQISHTIYPIVKRLELLASSNTYSNYINHNATPEQMQIKGINRIIKNNNLYLYTNQGNLYSFQKNIFSSQLFESVQGKIMAKEGQVTAITYIQNIRSSQRIHIVSISGCTIIQDRIYNSTNSSYLGQFIPQLNLILWKNYYSETMDITIEYKFNIRQFQYLCSIAPTQMNRTNNKTAYNQDSTFNDDIKNLYISSIGLYDDQNTLLAIVKLSSPIRKSNKISTNILVQLDYTI